MSASNTNIHDLRKSVYVQVSQTLRLENPMKVLILCLNYKENQRIKFRTLVMTRKVEENKAPKFTHIPYKIIAIVLKVHIKDAEI